MGFGPVRLILASASPRRRQMLRNLGLAFTVRPADVDESPRAGEAPREYVLRLAIAKAEAAAESVFRRFHRGGLAPERRGRELVLAADTIVTIDGELLGKPGDRDDARRMLRRLSGREHQVVTGVAVCDLGSGVRHAEAESTGVTFARLSDEEIDWYVASGEPLDKAGAYAVQGLGALFVDRLAGNYSNVVGLPLPLAYRLLRQAGYPLLAALNPRT